MTDWPEIRDAVAKLCERFPGEYWRALDRERTYPTEFVQALTDAGYLSILVPEEYGGSGLPVSAAAAALEEIHRAGCNGAACHAQMYTMGTVLPPWKRCTKAALAARHRVRRAAPAGIRGHGAFERQQHPGAAHHGGEEGQLALRGQRAEGVDVAGRALGPDAPARADHPRRGGEEADRGTLGLPRRHARGEGQRAPDPADPDDDQPLDHRDLLRRSRDPRRQPDRGGRPGVSLHPRRNERRARADRVRVHRRRPVVHRQSKPLRDGAARLRPSQSARTRGSSSRSPRRMPRPRRRR